MYILHIKRYIEIYIYLDILYIKQKNCRFAGSLYFGIFYFSLIRKRDVLLRLLRKLKLCAGDSRSTLFCPYPAVQVAAAYKFSEPI